jgi:two-component system response regulator HydG
MPHVLLIDDEAGMRKSLAILLRKERYDVTEAEDGRAGIAALQRAGFDLVITDMRMDEVDGLGVLSWVRESRPSVPVLVMTAYGTIPAAVEAMRLGAADYVTKPFSYDEILHRARRAVSSGECRAHLRRLEGSKPEEASPLLGDSAAIREVRAQVAKLAATDYPVLLTGETGTGKSLTAKAVHLASRRAGGPFVCVNCAAIPESLFESELFGHARGAFTGAILERPGLFEEADGGTLFLDEIGALPRAMQAKLLGVLQDRLVRRVGSNRQRPVDVRVVAATNADLGECVRTGEFRQDLFYRLAVAQLALPPLRERPEDVRALAEHFLRACAAEAGALAVPAAPTPAAWARLLSHGWPGNVRELENVVRRACSVCANGAIDERDLRIEGGPALAGLAAGGAAPAAADPDDAMPLEGWERRIIAQALATNAHNLTRVCKQLRISRTTLWRKMKKFGIA